MIQAVEQVFRAIKRPLTHLHNWGAGRMVCATASTNNPGMVHLEFQRKIGQNDIREGKLIARMFVFLHRKGGKYRLGIAITHDEAYMLRSVLDDAIRDSRRMLNAELVQGRPVDLERCIVETSAKYH